MSKPLRPCPFCESENIVLSADMTPRPQVACDSCGASAGRARRDGIASAEEAWNRRASPWRPWSERPRDGRMVLARHGEEWYEGVYCLPDGSWHWHDGDHTTTTSRQPTHWMPIPPLDSPNHEECA